ncbi:MAG TPA: hypothetical protein VFL83_03365 [Anaeromyxobacter sp.]|nr:hypothetical protein [Anaeromyxobacter sp.]
MSRIRFAFAVVALALAGCARSPAADPQPAPGAPRGKPSAPASVTAQLSSGSARVTVRFDADATDVRVDVRGAGGLAVRDGALPVDGASFARGEATTFDVSFTPGPGRSHLAVAVSGTFAGAGRRATVASFAVGEPTPDQRSAGGTVVEGEDGERIKVVGSGK